MPVLIAFVTVSCEYGNFDNGLMPIDFKLPEHSYVGEPIELKFTETIGYEVIWEIDDTISITGSDVAYSFNTAGNHKISLSVFGKDGTAGKTTKYIGLIYKQKLYCSDNKFIGTNSFTANSLFYLKGYFANSPQNSNNYLVFDSRLNCIDTLLYDDIDTEGFIGEFYAENNVNNFPLSYTRMANGLEAQNGSMGAITGGNSSFVMAYSGGFVLCRKLESSEMQVEFYKNQQLKLWSMCFNGYNKSDDKFVFNLNEKLYYISFDNRLDTVFIENFKNVSLYYKSAEHLISNIEGAKDVLLAFKNNARNYISFALYSSQGHKSYFYEIDSDCNLKFRASKAGRFDEIVQFVLADGSIITRAENKIRKYTPQWELVSEKQIESQSYGFCKWASNLFVVYENTAGGLKLSLTDKNLCEVAVF
ncbi:MAG: hypothetical protein JXB34_05935 [Bacteroidales bacterium]|nr:hypothetical protein [Bacteroidales bacterium]